MKLKILSILSIIPTAGIVTVSCSSSKSEHVINIFQDKDKLKPLELEKDGYKISTVQVNIFKEMNQEQYLIFNNVSSIHSMTRYNKFVDNFNSLTEIYKIKKDYWKPGMIFEFQTLENNGFTVPYIIVTYKKTIINIRLNFVKPYNIFSSIFYEKDGEYFIDKENKIKITEDIKEYELDIYKQDNYKILLEKEWIKPETKFNLLANLFILNDYIDNYEFNNSPQGYYNEWDLLLEENKIVLTYQDFKITYNLKVNDIIENLSKFIVLKEDSESVVLFNKEKSSNWEMNIKKVPDNINYGDIKLQDFAVQLAGPFNDILIDDSTFKLNDGDIYNDIKEEYRDKIRITYKIEGQIVITLLNYSIILVLKTK